MLMNFPPKNNYLCFSKRPKELF